MPEGTVGFDALLTASERQRLCARGLGIRDGRSGSLTVTQRFGSALNLNVHFHTLVLDGVFTNAAPDRRPGRLLRDFAASDLGPRPKLVPPRGH